MTPVLKGLGYGSYGSIGEGGYGYGYGHDVLEGFVLVWEKLNDVAQMVTPKNQKTL
jgi:hypothetical protein